ncbi:MAG: hypothetical protein QJR06_11125 [Alicyclobacillaceae bacterium]|nr:hypothetical protein [Alicyclobacillaceae bacterium]
MEEFFQKVRGAWKGYPVVVIAKEIQSKDEFPHWEDCGKNEVYVGIIREKRYDEIVVVFHKMGGVFRAKGRVKTVSDEALRKIGVLPLERQTCMECGEFSSWIYRDERGLCPECKERAQNRKEVVAVDSRS